MNINLVGPSSHIATKLSPTTILSIPMLVLCARVPESSHFRRWNTKIVYPVAITVIVTGRNFKSWTKYVGDDSFEICI